MLAGLRVTILGLNYSPEPTGIALYTAGLAEYLAQQGDSVTVVTAHPHYPAWRRFEGYGGWSSWERDADVDVHRVSHLIPRPPRGWRRLVSEITFGLRGVTAGWRSPDAIVLVSPALFATAMAMARAVLLRTPRVVWVQDLYSQGMAETGEGGRLARRASAAIEGWTLRRASRVVAIHAAMAARIVTDLRVPAGRVSVIANWSHLTASPLTRDEARTALGWSRDEFVVLHAGNMGRKQGLENVVEAAGALEGRDTPTRFVLMGDGSERARLEESSLGMECIRFLDPVGRADFSTALAAADVLLVNELAGVSEMAVPSKMTSYFAAGRPVIAAVDPDGIVASIVDQASAGIIVPSARPLDLAQAVERLRMDEAARERLAGAAISHWAAAMSPGASLEEWARLLREAARPGGDRL
ncbi:glycosyltransferase family 4 protein [Demequina activiva]|uniref:D-inositol 3-phosphate glycosyltransferase n=1 Tax=Demequina activiva TaxID=1582364 RepID=A0A919UIX1_9MICO|nr:glycosyltransferase family 4 protein [Demequina activiva]GIG53786.1 glycosyltransferase WbuB [Demequina activiva]